MEVSEEDKPYAYYWDYARCRDRTCRKIPILRDWVLDRDVISKSIGYTKLDDHSAALIINSALDIVSEGGGCENCPW